MPKYILALDQGTTSSRAIIFDNNKIVAVSQKETKQIYPYPGWVEHDPVEIYNTQIETAKEVLEIAGLKSSDIAAIGIANQRETVVLWDAKTNKPAYNAIVWQCRRTSDICGQMKKDGVEDYIRERTGLCLDPYFSASKIKWLLENAPRVESPRVGTIDTWLLWNLTGGKSYATDYTNASRTMLFNINKLCWDSDLLKLFNIPDIMPETYPSSHLYGYTKKEIFGTEIPICALAGDQQAALFGQACFESGMVKNTYGTGCFILMNTKNKIVKSKDLLSTVACGFDGGETDYAVEGSVFTGGSLIQWLRDELGIIKTAADSGVEAEKVPDNKGVYIIPAFTGLGAPHWNPDVRGAILGLTRGADKSVICRAALEAIAYQSYDVIKIMENESGVKLSGLRVDGGASRSDFLMQFQSDILNIPLLRPFNAETTAAGASYLAGLHAGCWSSKNEIAKFVADGTIFEPRSRDDMERLLEEWRKALKMINL
jgi:glycerol kinase